MCLRTFISKLSCSSSSAVDRLRQTFEDCLTKAEAFPWHTRWVLLLAAFMAQLSLDASIIMVGTQGCWVRRRRRPKCGVDLSPNHMHCVYHLTGLSGGVLSGKTHATHAYDVTRPDACAHTARSCAGKRTSACPSLWNCVGNKKVCVLHQHFLGAWCTRKWRSSVRDGQAVYFDSHCAKLLPRTVGSQLQQATLRCLL